MYIEQRLPFEAPHAESRLELGSMQQQELEFYALDMVAALSRRVEELAGGVDAPLLDAPATLSDQMFAPADGEEVLAISTVVGDAIIDLLHDPEAARETAEAFGQLLDEGGLTVAELKAAVDSGRIRSMLDERFGDPDFPAYGVVSDTAEVIGEAYVEQSEAVAHGSYADDAYIVAGRTVITAMASFYVEMQALSEPQPDDSSSAPAQETQLFTTKELV